MRLNSLLYHIWKLVPHDVMHVISFTRLPSFLGSLGTRLYLLYKWEETLLYFRQYRKGHHVPYAIMKTFADKIFANGSRWWNISWQKFPAIIYYVVGIGKSRLRTNNTIISIIVHAAWKLDLNNVHTYQIQLSTINLWKNGIPTYKKKKAIKATQI